MGMIYNGISILPSRVAVTAPSGLNAPTDLTATAVGGYKQIACTWTDNSDDEDNFELQYDTDSGFGSPTTVEPAANATSYTVTGLDEGTQYYFRIRAVNGGGNSDWSDSANDTTFDLLGDVSWALALLATEEVYNDAGSTLATDGQSVQEWHDQSGNNNNASQTTAAAKLTYRATGLLGGPCVEAVSSDWMTISDFSTGTTDMTFFILLFAPDEYYTFIAQWDYGNSQKAWETAFETPSGENRFRVRLSEDGSANTKDYRANELTKNSGATLHEFVVTSGALDLWQDGRDVAETKDFDTALTDIHNSTAAVTIGAELNNGTPDGNYLSGGKIGVILIAASSLSSTVRSNVRDAIQELYSLGGVQCDFEEMEAVTFGDIAITKDRLHEISPVLYEPADTGEEYKLWYTNGQSGSTEKVHYMYSSDGETWSDYGSNPVIADRYEDPCVIKVGSTYHMWVEDKQNQGANWRTRHFTASAPEGPWSDQGQCTLSSGAFDSASPTVWYEDSTYYMLYETQAGTNINLATSSDGDDWTADGSNPVIDVNDLSWQTGSAIVPDDLRQVGSTYYLTVHGDDSGGTYKCGLVSSSNLTTWAEVAGPISDEWGRNVNNIVLQIDGTEDVTYWYGAEAGFTYPGGTTRSLYRGIPVKYP